MTDTTAKFQVDITARDEASAPLQKIGETTKLLAEKMGVLAVEEEKAARPAPWLRLTGAIHRAHGEARQLDRAIGGITSSLTSMLPVLGGIGAGFGLAGIFSYTERAAEAGIKAQELRARLGAAGPLMGQLGYFAKMTGTDMDAVNGSMEKFNLLVAQAQVGKGPAVDIFKQLHVSLKDAKGLPRALNDLLTDVFKAFQAQTGNKTATAAQQREFLARSLFGKTGGDLIPLFGSDEDDLKRWEAMYKRIKGSTATTDAEIAAEKAKGEAQRKAMHDYFEAWQNIGVVVKTVNKSITDELYPALTPVLDEMSAFLIANKAAIASFTGTEIKAFISVMKSVDWKATAQEFRDWGSAAGTVVEKLGGAQTIMAALVAYKALGWAKSIIGGFEAIAAAVVAADAALTGSVIWRLLGPVATTLYLAKPGSTQTDEQERKGLEGAGIKPPAQPSGQSLSEQLHRGGMDVPLHSSGGNLFERIWRSLPSVAPLAGPSFFATPPAPGALSAPAAPLALPSGGGAPPSPAPPPPQGEVTVRIDTTGLPPNVGVTTTTAPGANGLTVTAGPRGPAMPQWGPR